MGLLKGMSLEEKLSIIGTPEARANWDDCYRRLSLSDRLVFGSIDSHLREFSSMLNKALREKGFRYKGFLEHLKSFYPYCPYSYRIYRNSKDVFCLNRAQPEKNLFISFKNDKVTKKVVRPIIAAYDPKFWDYPLSESLTLWFGGVFCLSGAGEALNSVNFSPSYLLTKIAVAILVLGGSYLMLNPFAKNIVRTIDELYYLKHKDEFVVRTGHDATMSIVHYSL